MGCKCSLTQVCVILVVCVNFNPQIRINHTQLVIENHSRTAKELRNVDLSHVVVFHWFITIYSFHSSFAQRLLHSIKSYSVWICKKKIYTYIYIYTLQKSPQHYQPDNHHLFFRSILLGCKIDCPQLPFFLIILISFNAMSPKVYLTISVCSQFTYYCQLE